jgi:hypothetical protein
MPRDRRQIATVAPTRSRRRQTKRAREREIGRGKA